MKKIILTALAAVLLFQGCKNALDGSEPPIIEGKEVYVPQDLSENLLTNPCDTSTWSYKRMSLTDNFAIFWQKGFGDDLQNPPALDGKDMSVDLHNLQKKLEHFYAYYRDSLQFISEGSRADQYRMMIMIWYSLEGTAYGGDYDQKIGAFWVAPNRIKDTALNCVAHELGHSFQMQAQIDKGGLNEDNYWDCGPFYEMASQFMLWRVNPDWIRDEEYHWTAFKTLTHKAFLSWENAYHSPYILEYWAEHRGKEIIGKMFRNAKKGEDAVDVYKRLTGISQEEFSKEMFDANRHILNLDFSHAYPNTRRFVSQFSTKMKIEGGYMQIEDDSRPEHYGFNAIEVDFRGKERISADFKGDNTDNVKFYTGFAGILNDGTSYYSPIDANSIRLPENLKTLYFVVMPAPLVHVHNVETPEAEKNPSYGYKVKFY